jgi:hypothetical protein
MMQALVVYESMFGNTERIALAISEGIGRSMECGMLEVGVAPTELSGDIALLVVGGPTHAFSMSRPATRKEAAKSTDRPLISERIGVREWLAELQVPEPAPIAAAFDTHAEHPNMLRRLGSAAGPIDRRLRQLGLTVRRLPEHFWVTDTTGPLAEGQVERAEAWGEQLAADVLSTAPVQEPVDW